MNEFRKQVTTIDPIKNANNLLGIEINSDQDKRLIKITMTSKIGDTVKHYPDLNKNFASFRCLQQDI
jgi:hypothetical protein